MPIINPDYSASTPDRIPAGQYAVRTIGWKAENDHRQEKVINWKLQIIDHPESKVNKRIFYVNTNIDGKFSYILRKLLIAMNSSYDGKGFDPEDYMGKCFEAKLYYKDDTSKYVQISDFMPYAAPASFDDYNQG